MPERPFQSKVRMFLSLVSTPFGEAPRTPQKPGVGIKDISPSSRLSTNRMPSTIYAPRIASHRPSTLRPYPRRTMPRPSDRIRPGQGKVRQKLCLRTLRERAIPSLGRARHRHCRPPRSLCLLAGTRHPYFALCLRSKAFNFSGVLTGN